MKNFFYILLLFLFVDSDDIKYKHTNLDNNLYFVFTTFRHGARFYLLDKIILEIL